MKQSIIEETGLNYIPLLVYIPLIIVMSWSSLIYASGLSDLKLHNVDNPAPCVFNVSDTFKPDIYNEALIFVSLPKVVKPLTFNDDNNVVYYLMM